MRKGFESQLRNLNRNLLENKDSEEDGTMVEIQKQKKKGDDRVT